MAGKLVLIQGKDGGGLNWSDGSADGEKRGDPAGRYLKSTTALPRTIPDTRQMIELF